MFGERDEASCRAARIGTVKSMISHTIPAAGVAGLIKTALALHHRVLPPTLACDQPNPELELERTPFYINTETRPWIHGGSEPRRAGINAFGFGGINAHAVLEESDGASSAAHRPPWDTEVCILEARLAAGARRQRRASCSSALERRSASSRSRTSRSRSAASSARTPAPRRLAIVATSLEDLREKLGQAIEKLRDPDCRRIKTTSRDLLRVRAARAARARSCSCSPARARSTRTCSPTCACSSRRRARCSTASTASTPTTRAGICSATGCSRGRRSPTRSARCTEARLMELDIAVESVLTANAAVYAVMRPAGAALRRDARPQHRRALRRDGRRRARPRDRRAPGDASATA